jgi:hypothetical protein
VVKLIRLWYKSRLHKYSVLTTTVEELQAKFDENPSGLSLTELGQLHYMNQEFIEIMNLTKATLDMLSPLVKQKEEEKEEGGGSYL